MSDMELQREQIIDVLFSSFCFVLTIWHDEVPGCVCVCVYFCRDLVLFSVFPQDCSIKVFRVKIAVSD